MSALDLDHQSPNRVFEHLFGERLPECGVVHIAAIVRHNGAPRVLRIGPRTPRSPIDFYVLNAVRAWADVVLTSGKILREEPALDFAIDGPTAATKKALTKWRGTRPPLTVGILSSGRGLTPALERWSGDVVPVLFTSREGGAHLRTAGSVARVEIHPNPGPRELLEWAISGGLAGRVAVELGPSTSCELYREPVCVDRLLVSEFDGRVAEETVGGKLLPGVRFDRFEQTAPAYFDGRWSFRGYRVLPTVKNNAPA